MFFYFLKQFLRYVPDADIFSSHESTFCQKNRPDFEKPSERSSPRKSQFRRVASPLPVIPHPEK